MQKQNKNPIALIASDLHLSDEPPLCRKKEIKWFNVLNQHISFMRKIAESNNIPIIIAGDIFEYWRPSNELINYVSGCFKGLSVYYVAGQHDLQGNNINNYWNSGLSLLSNINGWKMLSAKPTKFNDSYMINGFSYGEPLKNIKTDKKLITVIHKLIYNRKPFPNASKEGNVCNIVSKLSNSCVIIAGDNHKGFISYEKDIAIINPGSLMRIKADQINYQPRIYILNQDRTIKGIKIPCEKDIINNTTSEKTNYPLELSSFVKSLKKDIIIGDLFEVTLINYLKENNIKKETRGVIYESIGR